MHMSTTSLKLTSEFGTDCFCCCGDAWLGFCGDTIVFCGDMEVFCREREKDSVTI
jgi:hypothetical protein